MMEPLFWQTFYSLFKSPPSGKPKSTIFSVCRHKIRQFAPCSFTHDYHSFTFLGGPKIGRIVQIKAYPVSRVTKSLNNIVECPPFFLFIGKGLEARPPQVMGSVLQGRG